MTPLARWVVPVLLVHSALISLVCALLIGRMCIRLMDLCQIKQYFPTIRAGLNSGFTVASFAVPLLLVLLHGTQNLLALAVISLLGALLIIFMLTRRFPAQLGEPDAPRTQFPARG